MGREKSAAKKVGAKFKEVTRLVKQHASVVRRWLEVEDEGREILGSIASFASRLPPLGEAEWRQRMVGKLEMGDEVVRGLILKHERELRHLSQHLEYVTLRDLEKTTDDLADLVEGALSVATQEGWDPSERFGVSPMSACEQITHIRQLTTMMVNEMWRKRLLVELVADGLVLDDDTHRASVAADAARLWAHTSDESFVDAEFLERTLATVELVLP